MSSIFNVMLNLDLILAGCTFIVLVSTTSVSYTHLDVYKRQGILEVKFLRRFTLQQEIIVDESFIRHIIKLLPS